MKVGTLKNNEGVLNTKRRVYKIEKRIWKSKRNPWTDTDVLYLAKTPLSWISKTRYQTRIGLSNALKMSYGICQIGQGLSQKRRRNGLCQFQGLVAVLNTMARCVDAMASPTAHSPSMKSSSRNTQLSLRFLSSSEQVSA